jgi:hypothetical protein
LSVILSVEKGRQEARFLHPQNKMHKIVILQNGTTGPILVRSELRRAGLEFGTDKAIIVAETPEFATEAIVPNEEQFFVTGTIGGSRAEAIMLTHELRRKNPKLITGSFTKGVFDDGPFDVIIPKDRRDPCGLLIKVIEQFLEGRLRAQRKPAWSCSPR